MNVNIFESTLNKKSSLSDVKSKLDGFISQSEIDYKQRCLEEYKRTHIFNTYEEAIDYVLQNKGGVHFHDKILYYDNSEGEDKCIMSYEQVTDGMECYYDVILHYSPKELLDDINTFIKNKSDDSDLYELGKLKYVYAIIF